MKRILMRYSQAMRTTINLADDVAAAVDRLRRERSIGVSEAVNELVRAGLTKEPGRRRFRQRSHDLGRGIDVSNVADAIETLDGAAAR
jgi:Arc/MetJ family transcription regulator